MSRIIPQRTVDAYRTASDLMIELYGIDCTLYTPNNLTSVENSDIYMDQRTDLTYDSYDTKVVLEWKADKYRLRKLGLFVEDSLPMICFFKSQPDVPIYSYFTVDFKYVPKTIDTEAFTVVENMNRFMMDIEVLKAYRFAPRRLK